MLRLTLRGRDPAVARLEGDLDQAGAETATEGLARLLSHGRVRLVVDLAGVERLTGAGVRFLLDLARRVSLTDGQMVLCGLNDAAQELLDSAGLRSLLTLAADLDEARSFF
jgi:anti-anti-sigma factor